MTDNPADNLRTTLQNLLQLAGVATPRPWAGVPQLSEPDGTFAAQSANLAPALARFVLAVMEEERCAFCFCLGGSHIEEAGCPLAQLARELEPQKAKARDQ